MNLTELLATPVIDLNSAAKSGVVSAFAIGDDIKRVEGIVVLEEDNYCREKTYRLTDVKWGQDCLLVDADETEEPLTKIPFRRQIIDVDGVDYGYLKEVECDPKGHIAAWVTTEDVRIAPQRVWRVGELVILKGKKPYAKKKETVKKGDKESRPLFNMPQKAGLRRVAGDYSFLLGRTVKSDLIRKGEILLKQGSVINEELIATARENGVLLTLTELSR